MMLKGKVAGVDGRWSGIKALESKHSMSKHAMSSIQYFYHKW